MVEDQVYVAPIANTIDNGNIADDGCVVANECDWGFGAGIAVATVVVA